MTINTPNYIFKTVPIKSIDLDDRLTCFSFDAPSDSLKKSIEEIGIIHPITLIPIGERFRIVCGHHRAKVSSSLIANEVQAVTGGAQEYLTEGETFLKENRDNPIGFDKVFPGRTYFYYQNKGIMDVITLLWKHDNKPISFTLIVDDFGVKYIHKKDA